VLGIVQAYAAEGWDILRCKRSKKPVDGDNVFTNCRTVEVVSFNNLGFKICSTGGKAQVEIWSWQYWLSVQHPSVSGDEADETLPWDFHSSLSTCVYSFLQYDANHLKV